MGKRRGTRREADSGMGKADHISDQNATTLSELQREEEKDIKYDPTQMKKSYDKKKAHMGVDAKEHQWGFHPTKHGELAKAKAEQKRREHDEEMTHSYRSNVPAALRRQNSA